MPFVMFAFFFLKFPLNSAWLLLYWLLICPYCLSIVTIVPIVTIVNNLYYSPTVGAWFPASGAQARRGSATAVGRDSGQTSLQGWVPSF